VAAGQYLVVEDENSTPSASTHTIEIDRFVVPHDINRRFFDTP
jgi:non-homologous end joining protein Ku